jgi:F-type H+-transporting ATPase subunit gamma
VGSKLSFKFVGDVKIAATLKGPNTLEEVPRALLRLMQRLTDWQHQAQKETRPLRITVFHHDYETAQVQSIVLDPLARPLPIEPRHRHAPLLNLEPRQLLERLTEHYLFAALHQILYSSLMAENQRRIQHMDRAVRRIEQQSALLQRRLNSLRQEEITEEIEVIMLSTEILTR